MKELIIQCYQSTMLSRNVFSLETLISFLLNVHLSMIPLSSKIVNVQAFQVKYLCSTILYQWCQLLPNYDQRFSASLKLILPRLF